MGNDSRYFRIKTQLLNELRLDMAQLMDSMRSGVETCDFRGNRITCAMAYIILKEEKRNLELDNISKLPAGYKSTISHYIHNNI
jgi:hypothetical protein